MTVNAVGVRSAAGFVGRDEHRSPGHERHVLADGDRGVVDVVEIVGALDVYGAIVRRGLFDRTLACEADIARARPL